MSTENANQPGQAKSLKWNMIDSKHFTAEHDGYLIDVRTGGGIGGYSSWSIVKDGQMVDDYLRHHGVKGELAAKAEAERSLNQLLKQLNQ
jgi:hypothetical protein